VQALQYTTRERAFFVIMSPRVNAGLEPDFTGAIEECRSRPGTCQIPTV
jgi:hypothetical protein